MLLSLDDNNDAPPEYAYRNKLTCYSELTNSMLFVQMLMSACSTMAVVSILASTRTDPSTAHVGPDILLMQTANHAHVRMPR